MKLLLYCTKQKPYLIDLRLLNCEFELWDCESPANLNGKILAECDFEIEKIRADYGSNHIGNIEIDDRYDYYVNSLRDEYELCKKSCLTMEELDDYLKGQNGYAIHIKNLNIFDEPKELSDYWKKGERIKNAPQNMMLVQNIYEDKVIVSLKEIKGIKVEDYILISIRPEWLYKILNGEKTIEVRRKVLKEMVK